MIIPPYVSKPALTANLAPKRAPGNCRSPAPVCQESWSASSSCRSTSIRLARACTGILPVPMRGRPWRQRRDNLYRTRWFMRRLRLFTILPLMAYGQKPVIFPNGVVNTASYQPANTAQNAGKYPSPGSILSIFGQNLASSTETAATVPLPLQLAGTSVMFGSVAAPLFYVAPGQINFQMPAWAGSPAVLSTAAGAAATDPFPPIRHRIAFRRGITSPFTELVLAVRRRTARPLH